MKSNCSRMAFRNLVSLALLALFCAFGLFVSAPSTVLADSVIETQIDGEFEGWEGETVVKLMNGQVWIQSEYYYEYCYAYMPTVLIYKSSSGWKMKVEGVSRAVGVKQLR